MHPTPQSKGYKEFCARNTEWLRPYAVFVFLRDLFGTAEHWKWGVFSAPTPEVRGGAGQGGPGRGGLAPPPAQGWGRAGWGRAGA